MYIQKWSVGLEPILAIAIPKPLEVRLAVKITLRRIEALRNYRTVTIVH